MELCYANNEQSLFRKYADLVTWFTKHQLGRDFLGIPNDYKDISLMLPNGFRRTQDDINQSTFHSKATFAPKLYPALARIDALQGYLFSFDDALKTFFHEVGLIKNPGLAPTAMLTETTFNPDGHPESTSVDGQIWYVNTSGVTWATIRDAVSGSAGDSGEGGTCVYTRADGVSNKWDYIIRAAYLFDTSSVDDGDTVDSATMEIYTTGYSSSFAGGAISMSTSAPASNTALVGGDYDSFGDVKQATDISSVNSSAYTPWTLNATGEGNIDFAGISKFGLRTVFDIEDNEPTWSSGSNIYLQVQHVGAASWGGGASPPKLVVTHSAGGGGSTFKPKIITY